MSITQISAGFSVNKNTSSAFLDNNNNNNNSSSNNNNSSVSGEDREAAFLFQRISVNIQRFNSVLLHDSFADDDPVM